MLAAKLKGPSTTKLHARPLAVVAKDGRDLKIWFQKALDATRSGGHQTCPFFLALALALKAGCIWDKDLKKWMDPEALLKQPNSEIRARWQKSMSTDKPEQASRHCPSSSGRLMGMCFFLLRWERLFASCFAQTSTIESFRESWWMRHQVHDDCSGSIDMPVQASGC